jgi:microcystin degradation protein MlrC
MINVNLDNLKPGMVLAQPVRNHQGVLLLDTGAKVSKKNIRIFKSWGISQVAIKGSSTTAGSPNGDTEIRLKASIEKELRDKFCDVLDDPVMVEIFNAAGKQLMRDVRNTESENEQS